MCLAGYMAPQRLKTFTLPIHEPAAWCETATVLHFHTRSAHAAQSAAPVVTSMCKAADTTVTEHLLKHRATEYAP